jgi:POT family proton-dependent oligopeptide transporter
MNDPVSPRKRTAFPRVFWVANTVEILERFAYYGIYFGFGIYMESLGYSMGQLGVVQSLFLLLSYMTPVVSGTFADRYGFKRVLIVSYLAYLPSILLLIATKSFSGIALTMLSIGLAAGIFKPLVSGTVRAVTDQSNKTLGFGVFYWMVNVGASFGPIVAGHLRAISWSYAFYAAAAAIVLMLLITVLFYEEPSRQIEGTSLRQKLRDVGTALSDVKFAVFLVLLGIFFWVPFWAFFSLCALYVDNDLDTARLYEVLRAFLGAPIANFLSHIDAEGRRRVLGETISHTGWFIMLLQVLVSRTIERWRALPRPGLGARLGGASRLLWNLPVRARGDAGLAPDAGVHHLDRPQGEGRPLHGYELPRHGDRGGGAARLHTPLRPLPPSRSPRGRLVRARRPRPRRGRGLRGVREGGGRVPRARRLTAVVSRGSR